MAPHVDDGEMGCGGSIARFIEEGSEVYYAGFSTCGDSLPEGFPEGTLRKELMEATKVLGIDEDNVYVFDYPVRRHPENRQEILENLVELRKELNPELVFLPSSTDVHQDHHTVYQEGVRAFKNTRMLGYEFVWNNFSLNLNSFIHLKPEHVEAKIKAIEEYKSQKGRHYANQEFLKNLARIRGAQAGVRYAEAFETIRWII